MNIKNKLKELALPAFWLLIFAFVNKPKINSDTRIKSNVSQSVSANSKHVKMLTSYIKSTFIKTNKQEE